jgi:FXSXX-COOH protein
MKSYLVDSEPDIESELVDLGTVPLTVLRELDNAALHRATRRVVEQTGGLRVSVASNADAGGGGRID